MWSEAKVALRVLIVLTILTGFLYPLAVTGVAHVVMPNAANGSPIVVDGAVRGSRLVGQEFVGERWFQGRPSATGPVPYDASASAGSNLGPTNPALATAVTSRVAALRAAGVTEPVPVDLVTSSASGLDPHVSPASARVQVARVARARGLPAERVRALVEEHVEGRTFGVLGEPRVNVLELNLALERLR